MEIDNFLSRSIFKFEEQRDKVESDYYKFQEGELGKKSGPIAPNLMVPNVLTIQRTHLPKLEVLHYSKTV